MDKYKTILAGILFILALLLPIVIILIGGGASLVNAFLQQKQGAGLSGNLLIILMSALFVFVLCFAIAILLLYSVKDLSWIGASLPFLFSTIYSASFVDLVPDFAPLVSNIDDGTVVTFGAIFSFMLALHRDPRTPKWVFIPLLIAAVYTFFGGIIPGGIDELIVQGLALLTYAYGTMRKSAQLPKP